MNTSVENYFVNGCERCPLGGTPNCKVNTWQKELLFLRKIILRTNLEETCKWGVPCYTYNQKNVILLSAFKDHCALSFFKGALIKDKNGLLKFAGKHSQILKQVSFTHLNQIKAQEQTIIDFIHQAINIETSGLTVTPQNIPMDYPKELMHSFEIDPSFQTAFENLTPGKQRGYLIYFTGAKQSKTILSRIEKYKSQILAGNGMHDLYRKKNNS